MKAKAIIIMICGKAGAMTIGRETEILGKYLPQCHFVHHKSYMT
jgi:hypothetical protein